MSHQHSMNPTAFQSTLREFATSPSTSSTSFTCSPAMSASVPPRSSGGGSAPSVKSKSLCKSWPSCRFSATCMFDHPTIGPVPPPPAPAAAASAPAQGSAATSSWGGAPGGMMMVMTPYGMVYAPMMGAGDAEQPSAPPCRFGDKCARPGTCLAIVADPLSII